MSNKPAYALFTALAALSAVMLGSCKDSAGPGPSSPFAVVDGNAQRTVPLGQVPRPIIVRALDADGKPIPGLLVRWSGPGTKFALDTSRTDGNGRAQGIWILGQASGRYTGQATADSIAAGISFEASADSGSLTLSAVPDTMRFSSVGDTTRIRVRVRSSATSLDTLIDPVQINTGPAAGTALTGKPGFAMQALKNGIDNDRAYFGQIPVTFTVIVNQVAKSFGVVRFGATHGGDTITLAPDNSIAMNLVPVDARGHLVVGAPVPTGVAWSSSNSAVISMTGDNARGIDEGNAVVTAQYNAASYTAVLHVWTVRPTAIAAGGGASCAVVVGGELACWGFRTPWLNSGLDKALVPELRGGLPALSMIASSEYGLCGLTATGAAYCWGANQSGQVGRGDRVTPVTSPAAVVTSRSFDTLTMSGSGACALSQGQAYCWGSGFEGALGNGSFANALTPTAVSGGLTFKQISKGGGHACGVTTDGRGYCWGTNRYGQLGSPRVACAGTPTGDAATSGLNCSPTPVEVSGNYRFSQITAGSAVSSCGITTDGSTYCWGSNLMGLLGNPSVPLGDTKTFNETPVRVESTASFTSIVMEQYFACAIDTTSAAWCWGDPGGLGRLGNNTLSGMQRAPVRVSGGLSFKSLSLGGSHACGLTTSNVAYCWGWGGSGALGNGGTDTRAVPTKVGLQR